MEDEFEEYRGPSKSQRKRDALALQKMGEALVALKPHVLEGLELPERLQDAIELAQRTTAHGGKKRQLQYIGKLMRTVDVEPIEQFLAALNDGQQRARGIHHQIEKWRDRLLTEGVEVIDEYMALYPQIDRAHLAKLLRDVAHEAAHNQPPRAKRLVFRYLAELMDPTHGDTAE